ncbi:putative zinc finger in N-recognin-domain-containing protein [Podospora didyma]|uniref:Zinc finger in N-recognin-domain-containing protein n=1 Tax=Podospora didyma TaxID=330526 RepID=A0AAE0NBZ3_9PEZI|nr:putative zinc finger in N-recognin-domain-containing protein [Podospora didyma]
MDPPAAPEPSATAVESNGADRRTKTRSDSFHSQKSETSQTAADFIRDQMQLEADAREALPYSIENCTKPLGPLRQSVFACLTCHPPPANPDDAYDAAGVCYACSVQCHGEHTLVEIFNKRNFTCDCGTTRFPASSPCALRINAATNTKGGVHSEEPSPDNKYNQNFRNRFCGCECDYDPFQQKGTMFQCLGLKTHDTGGCGEDWWHPGCLVGLSPNWFEKMGKKSIKPEAKDDATPDGALASISEDAEALPQNGDTEEKDDDDDPPPPPGFPAEDEFEGFLCYKCVDSAPWIKRYADTPGFLPAVFFKQEETVEQQSTPITSEDAEDSKKRKAADDEEDLDLQTLKRQKSEAPVGTTTVLEASAESSTTETASTCKFSLLLDAPQGQFSVFFKEDFRRKFCRCASCFPLLAPHPQLLEEEETYEPPVSEDGSENGGSTLGSGSLLDRGESALKNVDRVRAIEGVMAYNHLKDKLKPFFQQFAESGQAISADDIKEYFSKLRGDDEAIKEAGEAASKSDFRNEQSGY